MLLGFSTSTGASDAPAPGKRLHALDEKTIDYIVNCFANAAEMAWLGGVEMVMIHGGHGWLLHEFLSPLNNHRTDKFGGSLENRARISLMVVDAIRRRCPELLIEFRLSGSELVEGGLTIDDQVEFAKLLDGKVDLIHVTAGTFHYPETNQHMVPSMFHPFGVNVEFAAAIKKAVKTPVAVVGGLDEPELMEQVLAPYYRKVRERGGKLPVLYAFPPKPEGRAYLEMLGSDILVANILPNMVSRIAGEPLAGEGLTMMIVTHEMKLCPECFLLHLW